MLFRKKQVVCYSGYSVLSCCTPRWSATAICTFIYWGVQDMKLLNARLKNIGIFWARFRRGKNFMWTRSMQSYDSSYSCNALHNTPYSITPKQKINKSLLDYLPIWLLPHLPVRCLRYSATLWQVSLLKQYHTRCIITKHFPWNLFMNKYCAILEILFTSKFVLGLVLYRESIVLCYLCYLCRKLLCPGGAVNQ